MAEIALAVDGKIPTELPATAIARKRKLCHVLSGYPLKYHGRARPRPRPRSCTAVAVRTVPVDRSRAVVQN